MSPDPEAPSVFRPGGISYLRVPAPAPELAHYYRGVFGWRLHGDPASPGFEDATGHVIGHFVPELAVAGDAGFRPYVYVECLARCDARGRRRVAVLRDPAGNLVGAWQQGARA